MATVHGARLQGIASAQIKRFGQQITVTRRASTTGGSSTTQSLYFLPQAVNPRQIQQMIAEGQYNAGEDIPMNFVCGGAEDIIETEDKLTYNGFYYRVVKVIPNNPLDGTSPTLSCLSVREEIAG